MDGPETLFVVTAFLFQIVLIAHFSLRKWRFEAAARYGPIVYALGIPAFAVSVLILLAGRPWWLWLSGFLYLISNSRTIYDVEWALESMRHQLPPF